MAALEGQHFVPAIHSGKYQIEYTYFNVKDIEDERTLKQKENIYSQVSKNILSEMCRLFEIFLLLSCDIKSEVDFTSTTELMSLFQ